MKGGKIENEGETRPRRKGKTLYEKVGKEFVKRSGKRKRVLIRQFIQTNRSFLFVRIIFTYIFVAENKIANYKET